MSTADAYTVFCTLRDFRDAGQEAPKYTEAQAFEMALQSLPVPPDMGRVIELRRTLRTLGNLLQDTTASNQAAWIEWRRGAGPDAAMQWIENGLIGPGLIPAENAPYGSEAQAFFDANRAEPFPRCFCGRPSHILWMGQGFCCDAHHTEAQQKTEEKGGAA